jgi:hypothetical protein
LRQENDKWKESGEKAVDLAPFDEEARANLAYILARGERKLEEGYEQTKEKIKALLKEGDEARLST